MRKCRAFTLVELIVAIVVIGVLAAAGAPTLMASMQAHNSTLNEVATLDKLRYASERMAREFREMNWNTTTSQFVITSSLSGAASSASFSRTEYLGTGTSSSPPTYIVAISQANSKVYLAYGANSNVLADNLRSLTFTYWDSTGTGANPTVATVRYVDILLTLTANGQDYSQKTRVALRNH